MQKFLKACRTVLLYMWFDEKKHWEEFGKPKDHIFMSLRVMNRLLKELDDPR